MKETVINTLIQTVLSTFFIFLFGFVVGFFNEPIGQYSLSPPMKDKLGDTVQVLQIKLRNEVSRPINVRTIGNVKEERVVGAKSNVRKSTTGEQEIEIYSIEPNKLVSIIVTFDNENGLLVPQNIDELKIVSGFPDQSLLSRTLTVVLPFAVIYALVIMLMQLINYQDHKRKYEISEKIKTEREKSLIEAKKRQDELMKEIDDIKLESQRDRAKLYEQYVASRKVQSEMRLYLASRTKQLATELDFWLNTVKQILLTTYKNDPKAGENLISEVRSSLGTRKNHSQILDPKTAKFYESLVKK